MLENDSDKIITQLRAETERLHSEIKTLKHVIYKMPGNIYWMSNEGQILVLNENCAKTLGFNTPQEAEGKHGHEVLPAEIAATIRKDDLEILHTQQEKTFEEPGPIINNKPSVFLSRKSPFYNDKGDLIGILGISVDITAQKEIEEKLKKAKKKAEAASRAKSKFLAMINHELRIPLTSILGFSNFLQTEKNTEEQRQNYIQYIVQSGSYLLTLVNQILNYSRLDAKKNQLPLEILNLKKLIQDIITIVQGSAIVKHLPIHFDYAENVPEFAQSDLSALQQILMNLIGNAIKFTQKGSITVAVRCLEANAEFANIEISVQDTGIGIPAKKMKSIFKEFYQIEDIYERSQSMTGAGLGLAIVKKLVTQLGGKIYLNSKLGQGSTFSFVIRYTLPQAELMVNSEKIIAFNSDPLPPANARVLLVEDDELVQIVHKRILSDLGCQVDIAETAKRALELCNPDHNIIFVDVGLPDINGFKLIKKLRKRRHSATTPIIALTGFSSDEEKRQCIQAGANEVLIKPAHSSRIKSVLNQYLRS